MEHKGKGWLSGKFRKAVLIGMTAVTLASGFGGEAFAQSNNGYPQGGVTVTQTQQQEDLKPWANDPAYINQVATWEQQSRVRMETYNRNMDARIAAANAANLRVINGHVNIGKRRGNDGWQIMDILQTTTEVGASQARYTAQITALKNAKLMANLNERDRLQRLEERLDAQYARKFLTAQQQQQRADMLQQRQNNTRPNTALTPEQQHDRLVRAYQDAQLRAANSGGRLNAPTAEQFGLDRNDPAIQVRPGS